LCLETEFFPDAVNRPHFPRCILLPGELYSHRTVHRFFVK
jgi:aldose 1-epimerase